jgi:peptide/nickel transport system substrate-binding protein
LNQIIGAALDKVALDGSVAGDLATSWTANADATVWTYKLRSGLKFSDGSPLTADDVVFSYKTILANAKSLQRTYISAMTSVVASDPTTVVFTLAAPNAVWPRTTTQIPIAPAATYNAATFATKPIGAGPYTLVSADSTTKVTLAANPNYNGVAPTIKNATLQSVPDETTRLNGLESGQYDVALVSGSNVGPAKAAGLQVKSITSSKVIYMGYNVTAPGLNLLKLRQAISLAIDRSALVKTLLYGYGVPDDQMLSSTTFGYDPTAKVPAVNVAAAKQLVQESGYTGQTIQLDYPNGYIDDPQDLAQAVYNYLKAIGINVKLQQDDSSTFLTNWATKKLPAMWLFSAQTVTLDGSNTIAYTDKILDTSGDPKTLALFNQQLGETDPTARLATLAQANAYRNQMAYYTPLFADDFTFVYGKKFSLPTAPETGYPNPQYFGGS